ncbi:MAG TPA: hypothetical protein PLR76_03530 [Hyphomonas sp.]|nr:hypothetical protein [Hyphomonas sp.]MCB9972004.1 hypothetical protein [Hyphomonas sp.]HPE47435.1 hypothetical protein [Hyphomonas sp.]
MSAPLSIPDLIREAWRLAARAARPALPWLGLTALAGGLYQWALGQGGLPAVMAAITLFCAGVQASLTIYRAMMPGVKGSFWPLAHMNLAIYLAFFFIGFFILFFTAIIGMTMLQLSGVVDLAADPGQEEVQAALRAILPTPYGAALLLVFAAGMGGLSFLALRLLLAGAATVEAGQAMVFRTWTWTKGHALRLGAASLATHVLPFAAGLLVNAMLTPLMGTGDTARIASGVTFLILQGPFILAGHGLAVAALSRLRPAAGVA